MEWLRRGARNLIYSLRFFFAGLLGLGSTSLQLSVVTPSVLSVRFPHLPHDTWDTTLVILGPCRHRDISIIESNVGSLLSCFAAVQLEPCLGN
jgi:hypothetical protein